MTQQRISNKIESDIWEVSGNEVGASMMEAGVVMAVLIPIIFFSLYFFLISHRLTTTHYLMQDSLRKTLSAGPTPTNGGTYDAARNEYMTGSALARSLKENFATFGYDYHVEDFVMKNGTTCYRLVGAGNSAAFQNYVNASKGCFADADGTASPIMPNSFISLELDVRLTPQNRNPFVFMGIDLPTPKVIVGARIGEL